MTESGEQSERDKAKPVRRRRGRWIRLAGAILLGLVAVGELGARLAGLGNPPLYVADPQIEYLMKPSMSYRRFGHRISLNAYSMRSGPVNSTKADPTERRVLVLGDSIINGGAMTDDSQLATALLQGRLHEAVNKPVYVGNISAASWGPPNLLAYTRRFGWFDADVVVIVLSSEDYCDVPTFQPTVGVRGAYPDHAPLLGLQELVANYVWPQLVAWRARTKTADSQPAQPPQADIDAALDAERQLIRSARAAGAHVIIAQHLAAAELGGREMPGHAAIANVAKELDVELVQLGPSFEQAQKAGQAVYRDGLHPSAQGQQVMADTLFPRILAAMQSRTTQPVLK